MAWSVWLYLLLVLGVWLLLYVSGDRWWFATVLLFGPRWLLAIPGLVLLPLAVWLRRRLLRPLAASAVVVVWPIMGLCLPLGRLAAPAGDCVRVLTYNVTGAAVDGEALCGLIEEEQPDVVALQECPGDDRYRWPPGWHVLRRGELLVASRYPLREVDWLSGRHPGHVWPRLNMLHCVLAMPAGDVDFCCIHLPSPRFGLTQVLDRRTLISPDRSGRIDDEADRRRRQAEEVGEVAAALPATVILAGDFNLPADSTIYRQSLGRFRNAFSTAGFGFGHTMRPELRGWQYGVRIDHVLSGTGWRARRCWVGPDLGSEHLPLIAELVCTAESDE